MARSACRGPEGVSNDPSLGQNSTYRLIPIDGNTSAVDVGRRLVLKILQAGVARLLCVACLEAEMEEPTDAVLSGCRGVVQDETEAVES
jgi:hypothetical protein